jgi:hypothetical protein
MTPRYEAVAEMLFGEPSEDDLKTCRSEIRPAVRRLVDQGIPPNAIVEATLAEATEAAIALDTH